MERSRGNEHRMESTDGKSYAVQLRKLCSHILGPAASEEVLYVLITCFHEFSICYCFFEKK